MRIIFVSCLLLSTCSLTLGTEYVAGVLSPQPTRKAKRFIFNKGSKLQSLLRSLSGFSTIGGNNNIPVPVPFKSGPLPIPAPASTATPSTSKAPPPTTAPPTTAAPASPTPDSPSTPIPCNITHPKALIGIDGGFDSELDYLIQYRNNAYAVPQSANPSQPTTANQPVNNPTSNPSDPNAVAPQRISQQVSNAAAPQQIAQQVSNAVFPQQIAQQISSYSLPQYSADLQLGVQPSVPEYPVPLKQSYKQVYSQPLPYLSSLSQASFFPAATSTYIPRQEALFVPVTNIAPLTYHNEHQSHLSYSPHLDTSAYSYQQSRSHNHFSFSMDLPQSAHTQSAYFGAQTTGWD